MDSENKFLKFDDYMGEDLAFGAAGLDINVHDFLLSITLINHFRCWGKNSSISSKPLLSFGLLK